MLGLLSAAELLYRLKVLHIRTVEPIESRNAVIRLDMRVVHLFFVLFPSRVELERPERSISYVLSIGMLPLFCEPPLVLPDSLLELVLLRGILLGLGPL